MMESAKSNDMSDYDSVCGECKCFPSCYQNDDDEWRRFNSNLPSCARFERSFEQTTIYDILYKSSADAQDAST